MKLIYQISDYLYLKRLGIPRQEYFILLGAALVNILLINFYLLPYITPFASDSEGYLEVAKFFRGQAEDIFYTWRLLKPVVPFLAALASFIFGLKSAFLVVNSLFYLLTAWVVFKVIKLIFNNDRQALIGSLLFIFSYPMLEYGIAYMTDLAGWFFFILCVYLALLFLKQPSYKLVIWGGLAASIGFLAKEYAAMGGLFFAICLFFLHKDSWLNKIKYLLVYSIFFLLPFGVWQVMVFLFFKVSYYDWYKMNYHETIFYDQAIRLIIKSLAACFLLGWGLVLAGVLKFRQIAWESRRIILALIPPSFSFLLWPAASSRLFFIVGLLLAVLASWGVLAWKFLSDRKYLLIFVLMIIILANYFWLIFDDNLRFILNSLMKINY